MTEPERLRLALSEANRKAKIATQAAFDAEQERARRNQDVMFAEAELRKVGSSLVSDAPSGYARRLPTAEGH